MVECCLENVYYKKKKKKRKSFIAFLLIFIIFISLFFYFKYFVIKRIERICCSYTKEILVETLNGNILNSVIKTTNYDDLIELGKNSSGEITYIKTNASGINKLSRDISFFSTVIIKEKIEKGVPVPIGVFSGIEVISSMGKILYLPVISNISINCVFNSEFLSSGLNQTLHKITCVVTCENQLSFPLYTKNLSESFEILISETVIVGKVPEAYLNGNLFR